MRIAVRTAAESDLPALLALYRELKPDDAPLAQEIPQAVWEEISRQRRRTVLAADAGDAPVGTADCLVMPNFTRAEDQLEEAQRINAEHHRITNH